MTDTKVAIVTGANTGLGYETTLGLAKAGYHVVLACRSASKADDAMQKIRKKVKSANLSSLPLDLVNRPSIREFVRHFSDTHEKLDVLVNNAGVMGVPYTITENGTELHLDANHVGHFLLTSLLIDSLDRSEDARIINVSSLAGKWPTAKIQFDDLNYENNYSVGPGFMGLEGMAAYAQSKLANILFTTELNRRFEVAGKNIKALVVHPGASNTDLSRNMSPLIKFLIPVLAVFMNVSKPSEGAQPTLLAALGSSPKSGDFYGPTGKEEQTGPAGLVDLPPQALEHETAERLWTVTEDLIGQKFTIS